MDRSSIESKRRMIAERLSLSIFTFTGKERGLGAEPEPTGPGGGVAVDGALGSWIFESEFAGEEEKIPPHEQRVLTQLATRFEETVSKQFS